MAEMPTEILQRSRWGFYSWWAGRPEDPFPDEFVVTAAAMGAELPSYFSNAEFITTGQIVTAEGAAAIYEGEAFPWTSRVPMVALDGRLIQFIVEQWGLDIQVRFGVLQELAGETVTDKVYLPIVYGHNTMLDEHLYNLSVLQALADEALGAGVPQWAELYPSMPESGGAGMPMYVMMPVTVLEDWAIMLIETAAFVADARSSVAAGEPVGLVETFDRERVVTSRREVRGPVLVGIAAIGLAAFGMFIAVRSGRVSRGTQVKQDIA